MDEFIGAMRIADMHDGSFDAYRDARSKPESRPVRDDSTAKPLSNATLNRHIGVAARALRDAATKWRDTKTNSHLARAGAVRQRQRAA
jgi:hypothetical protein